MNIFIVHAHHEPQSFNGALTEMAYQHLDALGHEVRISNLYAMSFDPVSDRRNFTTCKDADYLKQQEEERYAHENDGFSDDIQTELDHLNWCDGMILQFPLWWFGMPAILKGWVDRVFAMGPVYGGGRWYDNGVMRGKRAMLSLTTGGPASMYEADGLNGDLNLILYPINHGILRFVGFEVLPPFVAWGVSRASDAERENYLQAYQARLDRFFDDTPIAYPSLSQFELGTFRLKS